MIKEDKEKGLTREEASKALKDAKSKENKEKKTPEEETRENMQKLIELGIIDEDGKASLGKVSADGGSDMGDVDYLHFSDDEEDEFKNLKGGVINLQQLQNKKEGRIGIVEKERHWFEKIIDHAVEDHKWRQKGSDYQTLSKKIRTDYAKDNTYGQF